MSPSKGRLLLLPNLLDEELTHEAFLPQSIGEAVLSLQGLIAEHEKNGRKFLRRFLSHAQFSAMPIRELNEHTPVSELDELLEPMARGEIWGLISDAGLPCIADPGAPLVLRAHARNIAVRTFAGPSSILMALQLSGLGGQRFSFHGYLPREPIALQQALKRLEKRSREDNAPQIWIETPYRSSKMAETILQTLDSDTWLSIAFDLTTDRERAVTRKVKEWKKHPIPIEKERAVFLLFDID